MNKAKCDMIEKYTNRLPSVRLLDLDIEVLQAALMDSESKGWGQLDIKPHALAIAKYLDLNEDFVQRSPQFAYKTIRWAILHGLDRENK